MRLCVHAERPDMAAAGLSLVAIAIEKQIDRAVGMPSLRANIETVCACVLAVGER